MPKPAADSTKPAPDKPEKPDTRPLHAKLFDWKSSQSAYKWKEHFPVTAVLRVRRGAKELRPLSGAALLESASDAAAGIDAAGLDAGLDAGAGLEEAARPDSAEPATPPATPPGDGSGNGSGGGPGGGADGGPAGGPSGGADGQPGGPEPPDAPASGRAG